MEDGESRWTCEACGCNTNQQSDTSCSICGTSQSGSGGGSILRRGVGAAYAARAGWLARGLSVSAARRGLMAEEMGFDDDDIWESVVDGVDMAASGNGAGSEEADIAMESLAVDISSLAARSREARAGLESSRQRLIEAGRAFASRAAQRDSSSEQQRGDPEQLMEVARENAGSYQPRWRGPTRTSRSRDGPSIELGDAGMGNLAYVPNGATEGRAIRAMDPFPKPRGSSSSNSASSSSPGSATVSQPRRAFGFRVAFDHPGCEKGGNMGGCYLVGVTTSSFSAYNEPNGLHHSPFFWGVEDTANKYEGSRYSSRNRRGGSSSNAVELGPQEVPMNANNILFGSREVVTVVCDLDARTLSFWRDETSLGTLVVNLPRMCNLYPVAVPFNANVSVAITGLDGDPLPLLDTYASARARQEEEKREMQKAELAKDRLVLVKKGKVTRGLNDVLREIFSLYVREGEESDKLPYTAACRLWYRAGLKHSYLGEMLDEDLGSLSFNKFLDVIKKVVKEDDAAFKKKKSKDADKSVFEVGDKVELVKDFAKFLDEQGGPLKPYDRGTVVDTQNDPSGDRRSVRVFHSGRRWWYPTKALVSERSGLIDSSGMHFIRRFLRVHGYDHKSLVPLASIEFDPESLQSGDLVVARQGSEDAEDKDPTPCFGRIMEDGSRKQQTSDDISVQVVGSSSFSESLGLEPTGSGDGPSGLCKRTVPSSKVVFAPPDGVNCSFATDVNEKIDVDRVRSPLEDQKSSISERLQAEIDGLSRLERPAIDNLVKECQKNSDTLSSLFANGLPEALLSAVDVIERQVNSIEPREDLSERITAVGGLATTIADLLFSDSHLPPKSDSMEDTTSSPGSPSPPRRPPPGGDNDHSPSSLVASLQQRRSVLLSLMSRGRRSNASYIQGMIDRESAGLARDLGIGHVPPTFGTSQPFVFGASSDNGDDSQWEDEGGYGEQAGSDVFENSNIDGGGDKADASEENAESKKGFLDSILRCQVKRRPLSTHQKYGASQSLFVRQLAAYGMVENNLEWTRAAIDTYVKQAPMTVQSSATALRHLVDEQGLSIMRIAVMFGCSPKVLNCLVACGAQVDIDDIRLAAATGQHQSLSLLLLYKPLRDGDLDASSFSSKVVRVITDAKKRQEELDIKMKADGGSFVCRLLRRMIAVCLVARRLQSSRLDVCSRSISDILVGNTLLMALQDAQKLQGGQSEARGDRIQRNDSADQTGRYSVEETLFEANSGPRGLIGSLPFEVLEQCFLSDNGSFSEFLQLAEDFLCSKDQADIASGLSLMIRFLVRFPTLRSSSELTRYGLSSLISFHDETASAKLAELQASRRRRHLGHECSSPSDTEDNEPVDRDGEIVVRCPNSHVAVLHITRHSSFRCDLCGSGVERGRPMHGCRECDWDACENCMDQAESGLVKCETIRALVTECRGHLVQPEEADEMDTEDQDVLQGLSLRLLRQETEAAVELASMLNEPGKITFHQFLGTILPAMYSACVFVPCKTASHRSKKARMLGASAEQDITVDDHDRRQIFCDAVVRNLIGVVKDSKPASIAKSGDSSEIDASGEVSEEYEFKGTSELVRRLHQIVSLYEEVPVFRASFEKSNGSSGSNELQSLKRSVALTLSPSLFEEHAGSSCSDIRLSAEPLLEMKDLERQVLRGATLSSPAYHSYCTSLASSHVLVIERPQNCQRDGISWRLGRITSYDKDTGSHGVVYASKWNADDLGKTFHLNQENAKSLHSLDYSKDETRLILAARDYFILESGGCQLDLDPERNTGTGNEDTSTQDSPGSDVELRSAIGQRVESNFVDENMWVVYTLRAVDTETDCGNGEDRFVLVADDGSVHSSIQANQIRVEKTSSDDTDPGSARLASEGREALNRAFPFLSARPSSESNRGEHQPSDTRSLKRTWSALSLATALQPVDLKLNEFKDSPTESDSSSSSMRWLCRIGGEEVAIVASEEAIEEPIRLSVCFSPHPKTPCTKVIEAEEATLVATMRKMHEKHPTVLTWPLKESLTLYYAVTLERNTAKVFHPKNTIKKQGSRRAQVTSGKTQGKRSRKIQEEVISRPNRNVCVGLDEPCVKSMELLNVLSRHIGSDSALLDKDHPVLSIMANASLSRKLSAQLNDPVSVAGGALPTWCTHAPTFAPSTFTYECRRKMLERAAFGVSRGVFKQQEAKVNVGRYRQRMAALRARAVELVGEAFSGGAEDPTALQLQADELYGMEEALAARVRAAFRAAKWQEHSLQVAKTAVRRDHLLADAAVVMERYATDDTVSRRRLEVRFDGESGFDAASGDEAGVTRGFYADVAEALLSSETVAGVYSANSCSISPEIAALKGGLMSMQVDDVPTDCPKIPLWVPDMDTSGKVVIPTPRADPRSALGVYPRPLPHYHPQMPDVLARFRFIGQLFAAAVRDGFMFPLPLSAAFLRLVQEGVSSLPESDKKKATPILLLTSQELPRPGFLGGEVYAAEMHICRALDQLDRADPPLSRHKLEKQYREIAKDPSFARDALGKSYDCSFEEYFAEKTFVDPLDPTQGEDAVPLCPNGARKTVTIRNVREWVALAKAFILHDGVIAQATAFRQGVADFFVPTYLGLFTCEEWQRDICGVGDNVDNWDDAAVRKLLKLDGGKGAAEALVAVAAIGGEGGAALSRRFSSSSPTISYLVRSLVKAAPRQRRQFLSFVTSVPICTPGRVEVVPIVNPSTGELQPMRDPTCLPRANTCARRLYLPKFESQESFDQVLWAVVREECRFKGFYEWRG